MNNKRLCVNRKSQSNLSLLRSSPGGILFSSVAGGPLHVHSPDRNSENFAAKSTDGEYGRVANPVSLFNSLLDPNIELPTISVREVDEILSSLTTPNSSPVKTAGGTSGIINAHPNYCDTRDSLCHNVAEHNNKQSLEKNLFDGVGCSPNPVEASSVKNANITERNLNGISQICIKSSAAGRISTTSSTCRNAAENLSGSKYTLGNSSLRSMSFMCPERKRHTDTDLRTNQTNRKNNTKTVSLQSMMDILPLFPSCRSVAELGALALGPESEKTTDHSFHKQKSPVSLHPKACSGTNLCKPPFKMPVSSTSRDRSPIGSLDLATHSRYQNGSASSVQEATKYRQAYLSVRKANQAKVLSKSTTTVPSSVLENKNQDTPKNHHVSYQTPNHDQPTVHLKVTPPKLSPYSTSTTSDDRFKHICPHPRCGRRYQAEIGLLRHLVKYHGEQIELPRRTTSAANQRLVRRPASEERTITSVGFDEADELVDKNSSKPETCQTKILPLSLHSKNLLESNQSSEIKIMNYNNSPSISFEPTKVNEYTSTVDSYDKLKDISSLSNNGIAMICSTATVTTPPNPANTTSVSIPSIDLHTSVCSNSFSIPVVDVGNSSNPNENLHPNKQNDEGNKLQVLFKPMRKQRRLRSISGSHSANGPMTKQYSPAFPSSTDQTPTIISHCKHQSLLNSSDLLVSCPTQHSSSPVGGGTSTIVNSQKHCTTTTVDNCRRRTLSTGNDPRALNVDIDDAGDVEVHKQQNAFEDGNNNTIGNNISNNNKCPSCGYINVNVEGMKMKEREWISGIHALSCSKTDSVYCPVDKCTYVCSGRADLSAHLTSVHFPEIQHQLVRLIFACPLKDCQTICPDEASFQAHFIGHLRGHLPGDLTELFNPYSLTQSVTTVSVSGGTMAPTIVDTPPTLSTIPATTTTPTTTPIVVNSTPVVVQPIMDNPPEISHSSSSIAYNNNPSSNLLTDYSSHLSTIHQNNNNDNILSGSSTNDNFHVEIMDVQSSGLVVGDQCPSRINPHSDIVQPSSIDNNQPIVVVAAAAAGDVSNSSSCFNHYDIHHQQHHEQQQQQFNGLPNSPSLFSNDDDASITTLSEAFKPDSHTVVGDDNVVVSNNETDHVDLTDNRNLLSALDLIPDDILIELLKEDRPSIWGDPVTNNNNSGSVNAVNSALSAPYPCYTESPYLPPPTPLETATTTTAPNNDEEEGDSICLNYDGYYNNTSSLHDSSEWIDFNLTGSISPLNESSISFDDNLHNNNNNNKEDAVLLSSDDSSSWIPSNLVHHTWSSAIANEKSSANSMIDNYNNDDASNACCNSSSVNSHYHLIRRHFNCPHRVISDLTAALILPDVERRLKAAISVTRTSKSSSIPSNSSTVYSSVSSQNSSSRNTVASGTGAGAAAAFGSVQQRSQQSSCCSGKRRRNASESPPLVVSTYDEATPPPSLNIDLCRSSDYWRWSINDNQMMSSSANSVKHQHNLKTIIRVSNGEEEKVGEEAEGAHFLTTPQLNPNTSNSSKVTGSHTNNHNNTNTNDSNTMCLTTTDDDDESTFDNSRSFNNPLKIAVSQEQHQQQQKLPINNSSNTRSHSNHRRLPSLSQSSIEPRKRLKKYQKASTLTCQVYFAPYTTAANTSSGRINNSTEKYVIPRPVLPRRHSMASYNNNNHNNNSNNNNNNFIRSDCFTHLPH
ncbi:unnamed protein product [Trichobilharzia szidati]|nr:unnamed protein product [Trichobilharzia szidati]